MARPSTVTRPECGTNGGYFKHYRRGEPTCQACRNAQQADNADRNAARQRALTLLGREYPDRLRQLYAQELIARGLQPRGH